MPMFTGSPPVALGGYRKPWGGHLTVIPSGLVPMLLLATGVSWVLVLMIILKAMTMLLLSM